MAFNQLSFCIENFLVKQNGFFLRIYILIHTVLSTPDGPGPRKDSADRHLEVHATGRIFAHFLDVCFRSSEPGPSIGQNTLKGNGFIQHKPALVINHARCFV